jgi:UDP:flavonoid glycosyltransferase YjiC (YdhE family)
MGVCDLAIVHGGLTQTMDLTAAGVPFIVVPYLRQFEQEIWVRHRLGNYGATSYLDYRDLRKEAGIQLLVTAMVKELRRTEPPRYRPVEDNAMAVARLIHPLL